MPRELVGHVYQSKGRSTFEARWKEWGTERWRRTKGFETEAEAHDHLAEKRRLYRQKRRGDFDRFEAPRRLPIKEHVEAFVEHVRSHRRRAIAGRRAEKHAKQCHARLLFAFDAMAVATIADIDGGKVERFLGRMLDRGRAAKTRNDYAALLGQFTRWAVAADRLERDPLGNLRFLDAAAGRKQRQTLGWGAVRDLAAAGLQRLVQKTRGPKTRAKNEEIVRRRGLAIVTMFLTGLRNNELAGFAWDWIGDDGVITVPHTLTKSGHTEYLPLHAGLGVLLEAERKRRGVLAGAPVPGKSLVVGSRVRGEAQLPRWINEQLHKDAEWLKLPVVDDRGRKLTLYSMRTSFATQLAALAVPDGVISELMRHRPTTVTLEHYVQRSGPMLRQAIDAIPAETANVPGLFTGDPTSFERAKPDTAAGDHERAKRALPSVTDGDRRRRVSGDGGAS